MNTRSLILISCTLLLAACTTPTPEAPTATALLPATVTVEPSPTATFTPEPTATIAPTPTPKLERSTTDRPDDQPGLYQVHVLYVTLLDSPEGSRDLNGAINRSIQGANSWFSEQTGGSTIRFDTYQGQLDITYVQIPMTNEEFARRTVNIYGSLAFIRDYLEDNLDQMGVFLPGKIYIAWFEINLIENACGDGAHLPDLPGRLAGIYPSAVFSDGYSCADDLASRSVREMVILHEALHVLGFASNCGLNPTSSSNWSHTGDDNRDIMWAPSDTDTRFWDADNMLLDPGNDDYYNHNIPNCPDLANSAFLEPLPANAVLPTGWPASWMIP